VADHDPVGVAVASLAAGATTGASVITACLVLYRFVGSSDAGLSQDQQFLLITAGLAAGVVTAFAAAFALARVIPDVWRRAALAGTSVFAAAFLAVLAAPLDMLAGLAGLAVYLVGLVTASGYAVAKARTAAR
jgi:hypothetical protein